MQCLSTLSSCDSVAQLLCYREQPISAFFLNSILGSPCHCQYKAGSLWTVRMWGPYNRSDHLYRALTLNLKSTTPLMYFEKLFEDTNEEV